MLRKISARIQKICVAAKISVLCACICAVLLFAAATVMAVRGTASLEFKYLYENMAYTASKIFAMGVFCGFCGDFLVIMVDKNKK